jgi:hypothetical protein
MKSLSGLRRRKKSKEKSQKVKESKSISARLKQIAIEERRKGERAKGRMGEWEKRRKGEIRI